MSVHSLKPLSRGYQLETRRLSNAEWTALLSGFRDATIYQSWSYGAVRWAAHRLEHAVLKKDGELVGLAQLTVVRLPLLGCGIAYVPSGPLWQNCRSTSDPESLRQLARGLFNEYVLNRGLFLRMVPNEIDIGETPLRSVLEEEGFQWSKSTYTTILLDLTQSLDEIRRGLAQKWRNQLNRAERNALTITDSPDIADYDRFVDIYRQMLERKHFRTSVSVDQFRTIQHDLADSLKIRVFLCHSNGGMVAGAVCSAIGDTGIYLLGATDDRGLQLKGSYLLQWRVIQWLKSRNVKKYDLGGIDRNSNPGVYHFKAGISGREVTHIGTFEAYTNLGSLLVVKSRDNLFPAFG